MNERAIKKVFLVVMVFGLAMSSCRSQQEIGKVQWGRDLDAALVSSKKSGKPVFLLFQEVPG